MSEDVCAICYRTSDTVSADVIREEKNIGGKNPLLVCQFCFDSNIEIHCSGGRTNMKQKNVQEQSSKRKQMDEHVKAGQRNTRKD